MCINFSDIWNQYLVIPYLSAALLFHTYNLPYNLKYAVFYWPKWD